MATQELGKLLRKFYAEVKKQDGTDYEPDSLRIMQSAIERYLKEKDIQSTLYERENFATRKKLVLNAKAIHLRREGNGKRPNKAQPLASEEESPLWTEEQLGDYNARV